MDVRKFSITNASSILHSNSNTELLLKCRKKKLLLELVESHVKGILDYECLEHPSLEQYVLVTTYFNLTILHTISGVMVLSGAVTLKHTK
jgi:hypothetical protein